MDYWPNIDGVSWFVAEMLPRLVARHPRMRFYIVGRNPSPQVQALAGPHVVVTGTVPDVRPYLQHASAVVAPLRVARGIQNKILEAMAMQQPVVTVSSCADAIGASAAQGLLRADTPEDFVTAVLHLLESPDNTAALGRGTPGTTWSMNAAGRPTCRKSTRLAQHRHERHGAKAHRHRMTALNMTGSQPFMPAPWRRPLAAWVLLQAVILAAYWHSAWGMAMIWMSSETYAHGFVVPVISLWLVWRQRAVLAPMVPRPGRLAWLLMAGATALWLAGDLVAVNAATQLALVALIVLAVPAVLGWQVARALAFPLGFSVLCRAHWRLFAAAHDGVDGRLHRRRSAAAAFRSIAKACSSSSRRGRGRWSRPAAASAT